MPDAMHDRGRFWTPVPDWREAALDGEGWRIRDVAVGPDNGYLYVLIDDTNAPLVRLVPAGD